MSNSPRILVVDDDPLTLRTITAYLDHDNYEYRKADTGPDALGIAEEFKPDFVILDLMLPGMDGREVLKALRTKSDAHVMVLSALGSDRDKVDLLQNGADDYVVKPFSPRELIARIEAFHRRRNRETHDTEIVHLGELTIDRARREVRCDDELLELTPTEYDILGTFLDNGNRVLSRNRIVELVWGDDFYIDERAIDVHIRRLRMKIERDPAQPSLILTSRGAGYRLGDVKIWYD